MCTWQKLVSSLFDIAFKGILIDRGFYFVMNFYGRCFLFHPTANKRYLRGIEWHINIRWDIETLDIDFLMFLESSIFYMSFYLIKSCWLLLLWLQRYSKVWSFCCFLDLFCKKKRYNSYKVLRTTRRSINTSGLSLLRRFAPKKVKGSEKRNQGEKRHASICQRGTTFYLILIIASID